MGNLLFAPAIVDYIQKNWPRESAILSELRAETMALPEAQMQISADEGAFISLLVKLLRPARTLEVGVFTGYSSLVTALALPDTGQIIACDVSEEFTSVARRFWAKAGVASKIDLRLAPATETLQKLVDDGHSDSFDFAFIDADKPNYPTYYELCLKLLRKGGLIAADNVLWSGKVADPNERDEQTVILRKFNENLHKDDRIDLALAPVGDGLTLALKK